MGIAELIALATLICTVSGALWSVLSDLKCEVSQTKSEFSVIKWRLLSLEKTIINGSKERQQ